MNAHTGLPEQEAPGSEAGTDGWQRLHPRILWVDAVQSLLSLSPAVLAVWVFGVEVNLQNMWPFLLVALVGVYSAANDAVRWAFTRYRVTESHVQRRAGLLWRENRSVRRDRIRSVDTEARLWHRITGLRVISIGAGQQAAEGESAFLLDAVSPQEAERLRGVLLQGADTARRRDGNARDGDPERSGADTDGSADAAAEAQGAEVYAVFRLRWVVHNIFNAWSLLLALGLLWGGTWTLSTFDIDVVTPALDLVDTWPLSTVQLVLLGVAAFWVLGTAGLAVAYVLQYWGFELARVAGAGGTLLRTRRGLLRTREVNRDDNRMRGVEIGQPLLWRWMGTTRTHVITTGLDEEDEGEPTAVLPSCPARVAGPVAAQVLGGPDPRTVPLAPHPPAALARRLWWATLWTALAVGVLALFVAEGHLPATVLWAGAVLWPVALGFGVVAHRALGHTVGGRHLVVRSGLVLRSTAVLERAAVSTVAIRESIPQRLLGLRTVEAMTSAGSGGYEAPDMAADEAVAFAEQAAPGVLEPFLARDLAPVADEGVPADR